MVVTFICPYHVFQDVTVGGEEGERKVVSGSEEYPVE
jgi:hypothetical protein